MALSTLWSGWATVAILGALAGCGPRDAAPVAAADARYSVRRGALTGPDSLEPGWARVRVQVSRDGHRVVIFRLADATTAADLTSFLAVLDTAVATPPSAVALGGSEIGDNGDIVVQLTPGRYVLGCVVTANGHRHLATGEAKELVVTNAAIPAGRDAPPVATREVEMVDFAYVGPERWAAGAPMLRVHNGGQQDHILILARLRPGSSLKDWMNADDSGDVATSVAGVARLGPGAVAYLPVDLPVGSYVAYCLVTDPKSGKQHVELGMLRAIQVD